MKLYKHPYLAEKDFFMRGASNLVNKLSLFPFDIWVIKNKTNSINENFLMINAKSLVGILTLNINKNDEIFIVINEQYINKLNEVLNCFKE